MKLYYDKRLADPTYYAQQGIRIGKKTTTRNVKKFGKHSELLKITDDPYTVYYDDEEEEYVIEGPKIEKMLGYTNLDSEKGFAFFQNFLKDNGMLEQLEELGIKDGDTVRLYGHSFEYYK